MFKVGKEYTFYDDGKRSESRKFKARVLRVIPYEDSETIIFPAYLNEWGEISTYMTESLKESECYCYQRTLRDIWEEEVESHTQGDNFKVLNGSSLKPGDPWLYSRETPYFIECEIPGYDENQIWFAKTTTGGWFSLNIQNDWQAGELLENDGK